MPKISRVFFLKCIKSTRRGRAGTQGSSRPTKTRWADSAASHSRLMAKARMTHIPTGMSVQVTSERSQLQNKEKALEMLRGKLYQLREEAQMKESRGLSAGASTKIEWGSQISSYVLHPYQLVKDHRTEHERRDVERVLEGDIQSFLDAEKNLEAATSVV